jgi:hypothetical protein
MLEVSFTPGAVAAARLAAGPIGEYPSCPEMRLLGMQLQAELREPTAKIGEEPLSVTPILEADDVVVSEPHDDHLTARFPPAVQVGP